LTSKNRTRFDIHLLSYDHLSERNKLHKELKLTIFVFEGLGVELITYEKALTEASFSHGRSVDVMEVPEWWFVQELLRHLGL